MTSPIANPRRTTLAALRTGARCELAGPACRGTATRLLLTSDGERHACSTCASRPSGPTRHVG